MILRYESTGESLSDHGYMLQDISNYFFVNVEKRTLDDDKNVHHLLVNRIPKKDMNNRGANKIYTNVLDVRLDGDGGDYDDYDVKIIKYATFGHKFIMVWEEVDDDGNDGIYNFTYYNAISNEVKTDELRNVENIKDVNFKYIDEQIYFNICGVRDGYISISEDVEVKEDVLFNFIDICPTTNIPDFSNDYKFQLNNLNTIMIHNHNNIYGVISNEFSSNVDNKYVKYVINKVNIDVGFDAFFKMYKGKDENNVDKYEDTEYRFDYINYSDLKLNKFDNNIDGYAINYVNPEDGEWYSHSVYKVSIPIFAEDYNINHLEAIHTSSTINYEGILPYYKDYNVEWENFEGRLYFTEVKVEGKPNLYYPKFINHAHNDELNFDLVFIKDNIISYSYIDNNAEEEMMLSPISYDDNGDLYDDLDVRFVDNYIRIKNNTYTHILKFIHILNENINNDVVFVNTLGLFPAKHQSNKQFRKIVDIIDTIYNGGMKDLNNPYINTLFTNIGKYYIDDLKLYNLYSINLDAWFYDKRNMIFGDSIYKFIERLDVYKYMDEIPFEDIFTFAKSFGIDYLINESIFTQLRRNNNISSPINDVNTLGHGENIEQKFIRNALDVLRLLSKYRGSTNFYEMVFSVLGFAVDIELQMLNKNNAINNSIRFENLTNNVTLEIQNSYFNNKENYISDIMGYIVNLIESTLYVNRNFIGITYVDDIEFIATTTFDVLDDIKDVDKVKSYTDAKGKECLMDANFNVFGFEFDHYYID